MARCEVCGNDYDKTGCRIIGHGVQAGEQMYCCAHCARHAGEKALRDRA